MVLEGATDGINDSIMRLGAVMKNVKVLASCFAHNSRISSVLTVCDVVRDFAVELAEDSCAACVMQAGEVLVGEDDAGDFDSVARYKLNYVRRKTCFE